MKTFTNIDDLNNWLSEHEVGTYIFKDPDFVDAIIGISDENRLVYSYQKMVEYLIDKESMSEEDAIEHINYNVIRSLPYQSNPKPIVMYDMD